MEEKILIKGEHYNVKKFFKIMVLVGAILSIVIYIIFLVMFISQYKDCYEMSLRHQEEGGCFFWSDIKCSGCEAIEGYSTSLVYAIAMIFKYYFFICLIPVVLFSLIGFVSYFCFGCSELTVTDKRIYGKLAFFKRVDLPVDSISATATIPFLKGVGIATSSGKIRFYVVKNREEVHRVVNNLVIERQQKKNNAQKVEQVVQNDETDRLKKYKELLDSGIITQEEFDVKKKELLNL